MSWHPEGKEGGSGVCDQPWKTRGFLVSSPEQYSDNEERDMHPPPGTLSPTSEDGVYLTINPSLEKLATLWNVWRQIQGPFPYHSSVSGVLSHSLCLRECP